MPALVAGIHDVDAMTHCHVVDARLKAGHDDY